MEHCTTPLAPAGEWFNNALYHALTVFFEHTEAWPCTAEPDELDTLLHIIELVDVGKIGKIREALRD